MKKPTFLEVILEDVENSNQYGVETEGNNYIQLRVIAPLKILSADDLRNKYVEESLLWSTYQIKKWVKNVILLESVYYYNILSFYLP